MAQDRAATGLAYRRWLEAVEAPRLARSVDAARRACADVDVTVSILLPVYDPPVHLLEQAVDSVRRQSYPHWQLCIADDASDSAPVREAIGAYCREDSRIESVRLARNAGIAAATNAALELASGTLAALLDHDDVLAPDALLLLVEALQRHPQAGLFYSDSDRLDEEGERREPYFKTAWNYDLLLCHNYFNHLTAYDRVLLRDVGGLRDGFSGSQDYDLALRVTERLADDQIVHLSHILYHWREAAGSFTAGRLADAAAGARRAVENHLARRGLNAEVRANPLALIYNRVLWPSPGLKLAVLVFGEDAATVEATRTAFAAGAADPVQSLLSRAGLEDAVRQWSAAQDADLLCLIRAGLAPCGGEPLAELARLFCRSDVAAAGAALVDGSRVAPPLPAGAPESHPAWDAGNPGELWMRLGASNCRLEAMDQQASCLEAGCVMVRRTAFPGLGDFAAGRLRLRDTMNTPGCLVWSPHVRVAPLQPADQPSADDE